MGVPLTGYLTLSLALFTMGAIGVIMRRNPVTVFMCIEMMLNAANLSFVSFARFSPTVINAIDPVTQMAMSGQMMVIFVMAVAAAEVAVGLGIIMAIYRAQKSIDVDEMSELRG